MATLHWFWAVWLVSRKQSKRKHESMKAKSKSVSSQPALAVDSEVVRTIRQHARSCHKTEVCGILIGQDRDHRIEVSACIEGQNADEAGAHVTFTQDTWEHIYAVKDKRFPNERIVGWYHSHPGFGIFLSEHDTFIHKNFFSSPGQVAWVFDPHSDEEGCFGWVDGRIERLTRIAVLDRRGGETADAKSGPADSAAAHSNDDSAEPASVAEIKPIRVHRLEAEEARDSFSSLEQLVAKVFFSLALLALGGLFSWFLFPRIEVMPVVLDPRSGSLVDPQTGKIVGQLQPLAQADPAKPDSGKPSPAPDPASGDAQKGKNAKSK
jgi:proteasome lid subunit RPN8/RPN11